MDQNQFNPTPNNLPEQNTASDHAQSSQPEQPVSQPFEPAPQPVPEPVSQPEQPAFVQPEQPVQQTAAESFSPPVQPEQPVQQPFGTPVQPAVPVARPIQPVAQVTASQLYTPQPPYTAQPYTPPSYTAYQTPQFQLQTVPQRNTLGLVSLCTGIGSLVMTFGLLFTLISPGLSLTFGLLGVVSGIAAILTGTLSRKQSIQAFGAAPNSKISNPMATAGLICGIVGLVLSVLMTLSCLTCYFATSSVIRSING